MTLNYLDRIFWLHAGLGVAMGVVTQAIFATDYSTGILFAIVVYMGSYYLVKRLWGGSVKPGDARKLYTAGAGSYALLFLFFWILLFTLGLHSLNL